MILIIRRARKGSRKERLWQQGGREILRANSGEGNTEEGNPFSGILEKGILEKGILEKEIPEKERIFPWSRKKIN
ncbi:hypothetical protein [Chitinophaga silvisoli]|uniref:hypothetical protein n=1 Tax=Chitinophaga silvisoli TaxID=2291814 RepID=UPI0011C10139|nr:hypothetical protein [Chitinophaga silvisoli]